MTVKDILLNNLNPAQRFAVEVLEGPLLISAGAGSGKTKVLTYRIAHLIRSQKVRPDQILAVTFTNKASKEMKDRIHALLSQISLDTSDIYRMWISTFHSMCARILKDYQNSQSSNSLFTIYDTKDQLSLVKKIMRDLNINEKIYNPKTFSSQIALCKRKGISPESVSADNFPAYGNKFQELYFHYEQDLKKAGAFDFEGLLFETYKLFLTRPEYLEKYRTQFQYVFIDEYQDTNHIQYLIIKTLAEKHQNICVVGDEDQSIYSWRGADISNIRNFDTDFPQCKVVKLEQNYRSTGNIISAASAIISNNCSRYAKNLFTNNPAGDFIQVCELEDEYKEAKMVSNIILNCLQTQEGSYEDFAVFYRTNAQSRVLEEALRSYHIPYKVVGNLKFYDRLEVKDILAYLSFIANPKDEVSLRRIINSPKRGIGLVTLKNITAESQRTNSSFYSAMKYLSETNQITGSALTGIRELIQAIEELRKAKMSMSLSDFYKEVLEKTRYVKVLKENASIEALSRIENLQELGNAINQFELESENSSLESFLEEMALQSPSDSFSEESLGVTLMTIHISKGLEFNTVFMTGMEEGLFPLAQNTDDKLALEEERRLAYVGMTRAKSHLYLSYAHKRNRFGKIQFNYASQFLDEIPIQFIRKNSFTRKRKKPVYKDSYYDEDLENGYSDYPDSYTVGKVVQHPHFGKGKIYKIEGSGDNLKISVRFQDNKIKKFVAKYASLSIY